MTDKLSAPFLISGVLQYYAWGGFHFLPTLLGRRNPDQQPTAELWFGAHPKGPAKIIGDGQSLEEAIKVYPKALLGEDVAQRFNNRLPFLLKVLDVRQMLSVQVHPSKGAAEVGFAKEEKAGIPRLAPTRNYRDDNHKPELGVALTDFYLLHGFKSADSIRYLLHAIAGWAELLPILEEKGVSGLYEYIMTTEQATIDRLAQSAIDTLTPHADSNKNGMAYWTQKAVQQYSRNGHHDRGMFSLWWMNIVHLHPGEGIFQDAGIPHAYLEGACIEIMANSDNVLRGGLTPKHIDVPELLKNISFEAVTPTILLPNISMHDWERYPTPAPDFALYVAEKRMGEELTVDTTSGGPAILFLLSGKLAGENIRLDERRRVVFIPDGQEANFMVLSSNTIVYRAGIGVKDAANFLSAVDGHHITDD